LKEKKNSEDIPELISKINNDPDLLHLDYTPAVHQLSECGIDAAIAVLPLLDSSEIWERYRAQRVLEGVVQRMYGWQPGKGYPVGIDGEEKVKKLFIKMGNYQADASIEIRNASIIKWEKWLKERLKDNE